MALEHKIYLDGTPYELPLELGVDGNWGIDLVRESGITSDNQVLRNKTEVELTFTGDAYAYICSKKQTDYCQNIEVKIYTTCESYSRLAFIGLLPLLTTSTDPKRKTVKGALRDNSFSGQIRERQNNKVFLTATKSATGDTITSAPSRLIDMFNVAGSFAAYPQRRVWDVYDAMKWLIKQYTNDTVNVVSDYFTTGAGYHKYAITMGGMLYGGINWISQNALPKYFTPQVSFAEVFKEVRKKVRLFMWIDVDNTGTPTLQIETEADSYSNTRVLAIDELPWDLIETYDAEQIYSEVKVGSKDTKVDDGTFYTYPKLLLDAWEEETYNNCSDCVEDNTLDLVSEWIIDSNVIMFTLDQPTLPAGEAANVINGDRIFLIETSPTVDQAERYLLNGNYYYNNLLTNRNVFQRWAGGIPACVAEYLYSLCVDSCSSTTINEINASTTRLPISYDNHECEVTNLFEENIDFIWGSAATSPNTATDSFTGAGSYFVAPADGWYRFNLSGFFDYAGVAGVSPQGFLVLVFPDSSYLTTGANESGNETAYFYTYETFNNESKTVELDISTDLENGNAVVFLLLYGQGTLPYVQISNMCIDLVDYEIPESFNFVSDDFLRKPILWKTSEVAICEDDWNVIQAEKRGYITINGKAGWIKEINYKPNKKSTITLMTDQTLCCP